MTLGPLTNVAEALTMDPETARRIDRCVIMGGTGRGPGNVTPVAEFNIWVDPEAADVVFSSGMRLEMVGWDASIAHAMFDAEDARRLRSLGGPLAEFCMDIQGTLTKYVEGSFGLEGFDLPDPLAMAVAIDPEVATEVRRLNVVVSTDGDLTRGQTVVDVHGVTGRRPNVDVVLEASRDRFLRLLEGALRSRRS